MASTNYYFNQNSQHGIILRNGLNQIEIGRSNLDHILGTMAFMLSGDPALDASYDEIVSRFGFVSTTLANAAYHELLSLKANIDGINAALVQAFDKFR